MARTQDAHSMESLSQLPFAGPAPLPRETFRLFGHEFSHDQAAKERASGPDTAANISTVTFDGAASAKNAAAAAADRKFECHYCCRNFPTSQALGGHQNAHKRERQHAKRAHLQASLAMHGYMPGHVYGLFNYHPVSPAARPPPPQYPLWASANPGLYGCLGSVARPINGSTMPGIWRASPVENLGTAARQTKGAMVGYGEKAVISLPSSLPSLSSCSSTSPEKLGRSELGQKEGVSLDLRL